MPVYLDSMRRKCDKLSLAFVGTQLIHTLVPPGSCILACTGVCIQAFVWQCELCHSLDARGHVVCQQRLSKILIDAKIRRIDFQIAVAQNQYMGTNIFLVLCHQQQSSICHIFQKEKIR